MENNFNNEVSVPLSGLVSVNALVHDLTERVLRLVSVPLSGLVSVNFERVSRCFDGVQVGCRPISLCRVGI